MVHTGNDERHCPLPHEDKKKKKENNGDTSRKVSFKCTCRRIVFRGLAGDSYSGIGRVLVNAVDLWPAASSTQIGRAMPR